MEEITSINQSINPSINQSTLHSTFCDFTSQEVDLRRRLSWSFFVLLHESYLSYTYCPNLYVIRKNKTAQYTNKTIDFYIKRSSPNSKDPVGSMSQVVGFPNNSYQPITNTRGFAPGFVNYKQGCIRLAAASDKAYQLLAHGRWFSPPLKLGAMIQLKYC